MAALQGPALDHVVKPIGVIAGAPPPHVLHCLRLQTAEAEAVMILPVLGNRSDHHVANNGGLISFTQAAAGHAVSNGSSCLDINVSNVLQALPPRRHPSEVSRLQGLIQEAVSWVFSAPLVCTNGKGCFQTDVLQQPLETEERPVLARSLQTSVKTASPHILRTRAQHSHPLRRATLTGSAPLQGRARCMYSLTCANLEPL